jgi:hypothetical protein
MLRDHGCRTQPASYRGANSERTELIDVGAFQGIENLPASRRLPLFALSGPRIGPE